MSQSLDGRTVLVTGANGGLGEQFVRQALTRGAAKVYATARTPKQWDDGRVQPLALDLTDPDSVERTAATATDVDLLVNNAAVAPAGDSISGPEDDLRRIFETNFFGNLRVANAFTPVLAANGGGTLLNVLSRRPGATCRPATGRRRRRCGRPPTRCGPSSARAARR